MMLWCVARIIRPPCRTHCGRNNNNYRVAAAASAIATQLQYNYPLQRQSKLLVVVVLRSCRSYHELSYMKQGDPARVLQYNKSRDNKSNSNDDVDKDPTKPTLTAAIRSQWDGNDDDDASTTTWLRIDMLSAAWNPADAMSIQGRYPSPFMNNSDDKSRLFPGPPPTPISWMDAKTTRSSSNTADNSEEEDAPRSIVAGSEGWGRVYDVVVLEQNNNKAENSSTNVSPSSSSSSSSSHPTTTTTTDWNVGDYVVPAISGLGLYRSSLWVPDWAVIRLQRGAELYNRLGPTVPAPLFQTGGTALRMLRDFVDLEMGNVIVQNAGNSAVGFMVSQLASSMGLQPVSFVRPHPNRSWDTVVEYLTQHGKNVLVLPDVKDHGVDNVLNSRTAIRSALNKLSADQRPPKLALNAVGGESASNLLRILGSGGTMVTYGGMSQEPVTVATSSLIFRNVHVVGYWHSRWMASTSTTPQQRYNMIQELVNAVLDDNVQCPPTKVFPLANYKEAFEFETKQSCEVIRRKVVFDCRCESNR